MDSQGLDGIKAEDEYDKMIYEICKELLKIPE